MIKKTIATAVALALGSTLAFAGPGRGGHFGRHGKGGQAHFERLAQELGLTDAQKSQLKEQRQNFREANKARFETHRDTVRQYREALRAGDTARADELKPVVDVQRGEIEQLRAAQHRAFLSVLTSEQRAKLEALRAEREAKREQRKQQRRQ
jgi:Spy/CpxP family protein refolding chaperone